MVKKKRLTSDDLDRGGPGEVGPRLPVVLVERVLDRDDVVLLGVGRVQGRELDSGEPLGRVRLGVLEAERHRGELVLEI